MPPAEQPRRSRRSARRRRRGTAGSAGPRATPSALAPPRGRGPPRPPAARRSGWSGPTVPNRSRASCEREPRQLRDAAGRRRPTARGRSGRPPRRARARLGSTPYRLDGELARRSAAAPTTSRWTGRAGPGRVRVALAHPPVEVARPRARSGRSQSSAISAIPQLTDELVKVGPDRCRWSPRRCWRASPCLDLWWKSGSTTGGAARSMLGRAAARARSSVAVGRQLGAVEHPRAGVRLGREDVYLHEDSFLVGYAGAAAGRRSGPGTRTRRGRRRRAGPAPVFGVAGSSNRAVPKPSGFGSPGAPELAESMAGEPASRWKLSAGGCSANSRVALQAVRLLAGLAARNAASEV